MLDAEADEDTEYAAKEYGSGFVYIPFKKNVGFPALVNEGLGRVSGKYVLILNSDSIQTEGALGKMIDCLKNNPAVGIVAPKLLNLDGSVQDSCLRFFGPLTIVARRTFFGKTRWGKRLIEKFLMKDFDHNSTLEVDWVLGSAMMVRAEAIKKIGPMDKKFFMYFEDVDWCRRFWQNGYKVLYLPEAQIYHYHFRVSKKSGGILDLLINKYTWIHIQSAVKYYWKYKGRSTPKPFRVG